MIFDDNENQRLSQNPTWIFSTFTATHSHSHTHTQIERIIIVIDVKIYKYKHIHYIYKWEFCDELTQGEFNVIFVHKHNTLTYTHTSSQCISWTDKWKQNKTKKTQKPKFYTFVAYYCHPFKTRGNTHTHTSITVFRNGFALSYQEMKTIEGTEKTCLINFAYEKLVKKKRMHMLKRHTCYAGHSLAIAVPFYRLELFLVLIPINTFNQIYCVRTSIMFPSFPPKLLSTEFLLPFIMNYCFLNLICLSDLCFLFVKPSQSTKVY